MDAIYARQSIEKAESLSIQGQIDLCRSQTSDAVKIYQDRGYSGKNTNRPAFQEMMQDVERGIVQKIVVYRLDRFSRSIADFGRLWETLRKHGVEFVSINETFDTSTPMGRAMLSIIMVFAQLERETTAERVRDNYYQRTKLGAWPGGPAPFGFSLARLPGSDQSKIPTLAPNDKASVVELIYQLYAKPSATLGSVAKELNRQNIPSPNRPSWDNVAVSRILHSPLYVMADEDVFLYYKGKGVNIVNQPEDFDALHAAMLIGKRDRAGGKYLNIKDQHLSIANHFGLVSSAVWLSCQHKLDANKQIGGNGRGKHTWLSGLLKCASCGYGIKINISEGKYYLLCSGRSNLNICKQSIHVGLRDLEKNIAVELDELLSKCSDVEETPDDSFSKELEDVDRKIEHLMDALAESSDLSMTYINRALARLDKQRNEIRRKQDEQKIRPKAKIDRVHFSSLDFEQKKIVAAQFIQEIRLGGNTAEVIWRI